MSTRPMKEFRVKMSEVEENWGEIITSKVLKHLREIGPLTAALRETINENVPDPEAAKLLIQATYEITRSAALGGLITSCTIATLFPVEVNGQPTSDDNRTIAECEQSLITMGHLNEFIVFLKGMATERASRKFPKPEGSA